MARYDVGSGFQTDGCGFPTQVGADVVDADVTPGLEYPSPTGIWYYDIQANNNRCPAETGEGS